MRALAIKVHRLPADLVAPGTALGVVHRVEVAPGNDVRVAVIDWRDPARKTRPPEIAYDFAALVKRPVLGEVRKEVIVDPDPDIVTAAPRIRIEVPEIALVKV